MALERYYSLFFFPLSGAYCWNTGWLLGFVKRGEEQKEDRDKVYALILCSSAMEQSKPTYRLCQHLTRFRFSEQLSEMITDIFVG